MKYKVLLVDDEVEVLMAYQRNLFKHYNVKLATSGAEALNVIQDEGPFAVVLSDYNMPGMTGIELLSEIKEIAPDTTRLIITGYADVSVAVKSVNEGKVFRFLTKPITTDNLLLVIKAACEQYKLVTAEKELLDKTLKGSIKILIDLMTVLQPNIFQRTSRYRRLARILAETLPNTNLWEVEISALLSQIGALIMPADILQQYTESTEMNDKDAAVVRLIPQYSSDILKNIPRLESIAEAILYQDYDYDPINKSSQTIHGADLPVISRILKIVKDYYHFYDAHLDNDKAYSLLLTNKHAYDPFIFEKIIKIINNDNGKKKKIVSINELKPNMVIADTIYSENDMVLITKGRELSEVVIMKLQVLAKRIKIKEPIFIYE